MAVIPQDAMTVHAAIDAAYEAAYEDQRRDHLGASIIGRRCSREIWYSFRWCTPEDHEGQLIRLFKRGQDEEDRFADHLKMIGADYWPVDPGTGKQFTFSWLGGHFGGSCDGYARGLPIDNGSVLHVTEMKTHNDKNFCEVRYKGVIEGKVEHAVQSNMYVHGSRQNGTDVDRALYMAVNKNNDELYTEVLPYDEASAVYHVNKAKEIITSDRPPVRFSEDQTHYYCAEFCDHVNTCHRTRVAAASCRTCISLTADIENGGWHCNFHNMKIDGATQRRGQECPAHIFIPDLVPFAEAIDAGEDPRHVRYKIKGTDFEFANGTPNEVGHIVPTYPSRELQHMRPELLRDKQLDALVTRFDGVIVATESKDDERRPAHHQV